MPDKYIDASRYCPAMKHIVTDTVRQTDRQTDSLAVRQCPPVVH